MGEDLEEESAYRGAAFALLTQHGKEAAIGPIFARAFDAAVRRVDGFDTDTLGTFTRDVPRAGSQLEAARRKARLAIELAGLPRGLGSEGSFAPGPFGLGTWNLELVVLIDDARGIEIIGRAQGAATCAHALVRTRDELEALARRAEFPAHGLVVRPDASEDPRLRRGLRTWDELEAAWNEARSIAASGAVFVESDLRAHQSPTRMQRIAAATEDLVTRMQRRCDACGAPGFGLDRKEPGLPCRDCGTPTHEIRAHRYACVACPHVASEALDVRSADPARCPHCNP